MSPASRNNDSIFYPNRCKKVPSHLGNDRCVIEKFVPWQRNEGPNVEGEDVGTRTRTSRKRSNVNHVRREDTSRVI